MEEITRRIAHPSIRTAYIRFLLVTSIVIGSIAAIFTILWFGTGEYIGGSASCIILAGCLTGIFLIHRGKFKAPAYILVCAVVSALFYTQIFKTIKGGPETGYVLLGLSGIFIAVICLSAFIIHIKTAIVLSLLFTVTNVVCLILSKDATAIVRIPLFVNGMISSTLLFVIFKNIQNKAEAILLTNETRFSRAIDAANHGFWEWDIQTGTTYFSPRYFTMLGYAPGELPSLFSTWGELLHPDDHDKCIAAVNEKLKLKESFSIQFRLRAKDGQYKWIEGKGKFFDKNENNSHALAVGTHEDVTERVTAEMKLSFLAHRDPLTGLFNRVGLEEHLNRKLKESSRDTVLRSIITIDLSNFKEINERFGIRTGDEVLKVAAQRFESCIRKSDFAARAGGDEFIVYLHNISSELDGGTVARKIRSAFTEPISIAVSEAGTSIHKEVPISLSMGICFFPKDGSDTDKLLANALLALTHAKRKKLPFCFYDSRMNEDEEKRISVKNKIINALTNGYVLPFFQPISAPDGTILKFEALARIVYPDGSVMRPVEFIPVAEETGLIKSIGTDILEKTLIFMKTLHALHPEIKGSVNVSSRQLTEDFYAIVSLLLEKHQIPPQKVFLEITEETIMHNPEHAIAVMSRLRALGVSFSIDDFGTGYSSLGRIKNLPIDEFKIDRSFVKDILLEKEGELNRTIIKSLINIASSRAVSLVIEGVETKDELDVIAGLGCRQIQGYYFSRPLSEKDFLLKASGNRTT